MKETEKESVYTVGQCYAGWQTKQEGFCIEWGKDTGLTLYAMMNGISKEEREQFKADKRMTVKFIIISDVCYFLFRFGDMPWADCPFSPALYRTAGREIAFKEMDEEKGIALTVLLIDTSTGELCNIRLIGLGHDFSVKWQDWAEGALEKAVSFEEYNKQIDDAYARYTSADLALMAKDEYVI